MGFFKVLLSIILIILLLAVGFMVYDVYFTQDDDCNPPEIDVDFNFTIDNKTAGDYVKDKIGVGVGELPNIPSIERGGNAAS